MMRAVYEVGGKGHSCGIYSFDDDHIHRLALVAPVSRIMVRQPQSKANAGTFNNGMPMTSSLGCGIWGGNITTENVHLKHYMNTTWVSGRSRRTSRPTRSCSASSTTRRSKPKCETHHDVNSRASAMTEPAATEHATEGHAIAPTSWSSTSRRRGVEAHLRPVRPHQHRGARRRLSKSRRSSSSTRGTSRSPRTRPTATRARRSKAVGAC